MSLNEKEILNKIENFIFNEADEEDIQKLTFDLLHKEIDTSDIEHDLLVNINQHVFNDLTIEELNQLAEEYLI